MDRVGWARVGLWVFSAGMLGWVVANATQALFTNVLTDAIIVVGGLLAAYGLPGAVDGVGHASLRTGLMLTALCQFGQNVVTILTKLNAVNGAPATIVMLCSVCMGVGVVLWNEDGWNRRSLLWICIGFAGFAFEPVYYFFRSLGGNIVGPYFTGQVLVAVGGGLAAWAFRPSGEDPVPLIPLPREA